MYHSFEDLGVWKGGWRLAVEVSRTLAKSREYFVRDQMQGAARSIPPNVAEGSAAEWRTPGYLAKRPELIAKADADEFIQETKELSARLPGLIRSFQRTDN